MSAPKDKKATFLQSLLPVVFLFVIIIYGLVLRPMFFKQEVIPLEIIFLTASIFAITQLRILGYAWKDIQVSIINKSWLKYERH